jgi:hypothetical protein
MLFYNRTVMKKAEAVSAKQFDILYILGGEPSDLLLAKRCDCATPSSAMVQNMAHCPRDFKFYVLLVVTVYIGRSLRHDFQYLYWPMPTAQPPHVIDNHDGFGPDFFVEEMVRPRGGVVIRSLACSHNTGGPEALVQLILAFDSWTETYVSSPASNCADVFKTEYPALDRVRTKSEDELSPSDIFIQEEGPPCPVDLVRRGVHVLVYQLAVQPRAVTDEKLAQGCHIISHNYWLSGNHGLNPDNEYLIRPYVTPSIVRNVSTEVKNLVRKRLVLIDNDTPSVIIETHIVPACKSLDLDWIIVQGFTRSAVNQLLNEAMIIIDWCVIGSERLPIEAVLNGVIFVTTDCACAQDRRDFPLPAGNILSREASPEHVFLTFKNIVNNFSAIQEEYAPMRKLYGSYIGQETMANESKFFIRKFAAAKRLLTHNV